MIKVRKAFVVCRSGSITGGPEALHQLVYSMLRLGIDASIVYHGASSEVMVPDEYKHYDVPVSDYIEDATDNVIICPEKMVDVLLRFSYCQKILWWLSANYYPAANKPQIIHACQSQYAFDTLENNGISNKVMLTDFTRDICLTSNILPKKDIVVYNPAKGYEYTKKIIEKAKDINFVPLENLTPNTARDLLCRSKIYIDMGHSPGKDRIPREAAISNCIVITSDKGAFRYHEDTPIPPSYKFSLDYFSIDSIIEKIRRSLSEYYTKIDDFKFYRQKIRNEKSDFEKEISRLFNTQNK